MVVRTTRPETRPETGELEERSVGVVGPIVSDQAVCVVRESSKSISGGGTMGWSGWTVWGLVGRSASRSQGRSPSGQGGKSRPTGLSGTPEAFPVRIDGSLRC